MIDLLASKTVDELNSLIQKYETVLVFFELEERTRFAIILEIAIPYIKNNYSDLNSYWKTWAIVSLKQLLHKIFSESNVKEIIDSFIEYYRTEYQNYIDGLVLYASEYDRDCEFVNRFIHTFLNKKIGGY